MCRLGHQFLVHSLHTNKEELSGHVGVKDSLSWSYHEVTQLKSYEKWARQRVESQLWSLGEETSACSETCLAQSHERLPWRAKGLRRAHWPSRTASSGVTDQQNPTVEEDLEEMGKSDELREGCEEWKLIIIKISEFISTQRGLEGDLCFRYTAVPVDHWVVVV